MNNPLADTQKELIRRLDAIPDPVSGDGLHTAGRIGGLKISQDGKVSFTIEAPAKLAPQYRKVRDRAEAAVRAAPGVTQVTAVLTAHESAAAPAGGIGQVGMVIAISSAKGGVGKSSVAANLACALAAQGKRVGLLDLDVYGPSLPTILGLQDAKPVSRPDGTLEPVVAHGLKTMSIGFLVDSEAPMIWRGPMATGAIKQMIDQVAWGELDVLLLDLPPGTGDIQLTLVQRVQLAGAVIVSTPQEMALADVRRGIAMFEKAHTPILGIVENMAYFEAPTGERLPIFGEGGARRTAEACGTPFLGEIPLVQALRESADAGAPYVATHADTPVTEAFKSIATAVIDNATRMKRPAPAIRFV